MTDQERLMALGVPGQLALEMTRQFSGDVGEAVDYSNQIAALQQSVAALSSPTVRTGWGNYTDTQYTVGSPRALAANTDTLVPNNKASVIESQLPSDVATFYDGTVITGRNGDGMLITLDMVVVPTNAGTTYIDLWFDIGGSVGELYRQTISFPKGQNVARNVNFTVQVYTLDTWQANGARVYMRANGTANVYNIRYIIGRFHKAK